MDGIPSGLARGAVSSADCAVVICGADRRLGAAAAGDSRAPLEQLLGMSSTVAQFGQDALDNLSLDWKGRTYEVR